MATPRESRERVRGGARPSTRARRGAEPPAGAKRPIAPAPQDPTVPQAAPTQAGDEPRIVDERHYIGPYGEEENVVTDDRGRRFYSFRPAAGYRYRYDLLGYGWFWWLVLWLCIIGAIVWAWGWGY